MSTNGNILIADDEEGFRLSTAALLSEREFDCVCVADAEAALKVINSGWPDVILADINMPGNSELEFLVQMRDANTDVASILCTGYPSFGTAAQSLNLGVTGYLVKPFEIDELTQLVERSLREIRNIRLIRKMGERLESLSNDVNSIAELRTGAMRMELGQSTGMVLNLAFDGIIGILLDLKSELTHLSALPVQLSQGHDTVVQKLAASIFDSTPKLKSLSPREREVLTALISGDRVVTIATTLFISKHTVRNHLKSIFGKLGVRSQVELLQQLKGVVSP